jgi:light-regulated signal transduction histidine kinase (bacteriophytochrome)
MKIKDFKGEVIDQLSVNITNGNDLVNRINESINTLNNLSPIYDKQLKLKEDEEFEELPQAEPGDINGALKSLQEVYDILMDLAEKVDGITDYFEDDEAEDKNQIISYVATLYDLAMDISEYRTDKIEEMHEGDDEDVNESVKVCKTAKSSCMNALNNITVAEAMLRGHKEFKDVQQVLKNVRTELELRK